MASRITETAFNPEAELAAFAAERSGIGALASFVGYCRDDSHGRPVNGLFIQHYPGFSEREIERLTKDVAERFKVKDLLVIHRVGDIPPGDAIVLVAALSSHRNAAFETVRVMMDYQQCQALASNAGPRVCRRDQSQCAHALWVLGGQEQTSATAVRASDQIARGNTENVKEGEQTVCGRRQVCIQFGRIFREARARHVEGKDFALLRKAIQYSSPTERVSKQPVDKNYRRSVSPTVESYCSPTNKP